MKYFIIYAVVFAFSIIGLKGQGLYFERIDSNKVKVYFSYFGNVVGPSSYEFYRIGKLNTNLTEFQGKVSDYNSGNRLLFEAYFSGNSLNGAFSLYHENGRIKAKGYYKDNERDSIWTVYYKNGKVQMKLNFSKRIYLLEYFEPSGKIMVSKGNGLIKLQSNNYIPNIHGELKNGLRVGIWKNSQYSEHYDDNGNLLYGINDYNKETYYETQFLYFYPFPNEKALLQPIRTLEINGTKLVMP